MKLSDSAVPVVDEEENSPPAASPKEDYKDEELAKELQDTPANLVGENLEDAPATGMSRATALFDTGGKGFLTPSERVLRTYDEDNDGHLGVQELKAIVKDLHKAKAGSSFYKKLAMGAGCCLLASFAGNFGLTWSVVKLTQQLATTDDGALVDARTGKAVVTQSKGNHVDLKFEPKLSRRLREKIEEASRRRELSDSSDPELLQGQDAELRRLVEEHLALTTVSCASDCAAALFSQNAAGTATSFSFQAANMTFSGTIQAGVTQTLRSSREGCDTYSNIHKVGDESNELYNVQCCGEEDCQVRLGDPTVATSHHDGRRLGMSVADPNVDCPSKHLGYPRTQSVFPSECSSGREFPCDDLFTANRACLKANGCHGGPNPGGPLSTHCGNLYQGSCTSPCYWDEINAFMNHIVRPCHNGPVPKLIMGSTHCSGYDTQAICNDDRVPHCYWGDVWRNFQGAACPGQEECESEEACYWVPLIHSDYGVCRNRPSSDECVARAIPYFLAEDWNNFHAAWVQCGRLSQGRNYQACFSEKSTVMEQKKGKVFLKDLEAEDRVLAAEGVYQPFVGFYHYQASEHARFLQIYTEGQTDALEITPNHLVFLDRHDLPVPAAKVKVGDALVGHDGPQKVMKIAHVVRQGSFAAMTKDATHFIDGVLASSIAVDAGDEYFRVGPLKIHLHTAYSRVAAPLNHAYCRTINPFLCQTLVEDGTGGSTLLLKLAWEAAGSSSFLSIALLVAEATILLCYHASFILALLSVTGLVFALLKTKSHKTGSSTSFLARHMGLDGCKKLHAA